MLIKNYLKLNISFYISLILAFLILLLPKEYKVGMYGVTLIAYFQVLLVLFMSLNFIVLFVIDMMRGEFKNVIIRSIITFLIVLISVQYWFWTSSL